MQSVCNRLGGRAPQSLQHRLERLGSDTWRFHHHPGRTVASYDFRLRPRQLAEFAGRSHELSTSPDSGYVTTLIAARPVADATLLLLSRTVRRLSANSRESWTVSSVEEFADVLYERLLIPLDDLGPDGVARLWGKAGVQDDLWHARVENSSRT
ncbi:arylamine N-acetyltransferase [Pseudonocardia sp. CA-142604]|uniref:arylamine N-acetyltransferase n=1 Tax=Pseudonocardia sp. CA-142604 TaxID=3240024 RepID=UPI003D92B54E